VPQKSWRAWVTPKLSPADIHRSHAIFTEHVAICRRLSRQPPGDRILLVKATEVEKADATLAEELRGTAKTMAYNLASNTWPGWNETGIRITPADIEAGMEAARLNLRLAIELKRGPDPMFNAHWVIGALELARGRHDEAIASYEQARKIATDSNLRAYALLAGGSIAIAKIAGKINVSEGERDLAQVKSSLTSENLNDGKFFADQLEATYQIFVKK
jgi:tetratricopeptide (TPR) repeat protein